VRRRHTAQAAHQSAPHFQRQHQQQQQGSFGGLFTMIAILVALFLITSFLRQEPAPEYSIQVSFFKLF